MRLIRDLQADIGVNDEGVGVILDLIDQVHGLRRTLGDLLSAIHAQPEDMRERLAMHVHATMTDYWARPVPEREPPDRDRERQISGQIHTPVRELKAGTFGSLTAL